MTGGTGKAQVGIYLVVIGDFLVAEDLRQAICEGCEGAVVISVRSVALAGAALQAQGAARVGMAFVGGDPKVFLASDLARDLAGQGTRVVLTGTTPPDRAAALGYQALVYPFSTADVLALL